MQFASTEWGCKVVVIPELESALPRACTPRSPCEAEWWLQH